MKYTVLWRPWAENSLAALWSGAMDRDLIASAANRIDALLSQDAGDLGESRAGSVRIMFESPLSITFEVSEADRTVYVLTLHRTRG